ncbi:MAG TPA: helix-turn-helix domain-containing protein [Ohtaekwangia sp.]|nr:helix-turn-helix domain-containing protein [Ohtaekwangia sp.]
MVNLFDFAHDNRLFKQFKVSDLLFTEYKCLEKQPVFQIWSHYNYFVYVLSGQKKWQTLNAEYLVHTGEAIFVKKGASIIHKFFEVDFCALILFVPDDFIANVFQQNGFKFPADGNTHQDAVFPLAMDETLSAYFQSVFSYFLKNEPPPTSLLEIKFKELILNLICSPENQALCNYFRLLSSESKTSIRDVMETNFPFNLKLEEFARLSGRSLTTFKKDFVTTYGTTPGKWLTKKRLALAQRLLENSDKNITQVAFESGFENTSHFITVFKKEHSITPLQFKRSARMAS